MKFQTENLFKRFHLSFREKSYIPQRRVAVSLLVTVVFSFHLVVGLYRFSFVEQIENILYDIRLKLTMPNTVDSRIVIVDIDEKSLAVEGRWPWGRDRLAQLTDNLFDYYQADLLGFDVVFAEMDESSGLKLLDALAKNPLRNNEQFLDELNKLRPSLKRDLLFAESFENRNIVLGYYFQPEWQIQNNMEVGKLPEPLMTLSESRTRNIPFVVTNGYVGNLHVLQRSASSGGYFDNLLVDTDGVFRKIPLVQEYNGKLYESFSLAVVRLIMGFPRLELIITSEGKEASPLGLEYLEIGGLQIPVDEQGAALVPYRGKQGSFQYVSAVDVLRKKVDKDLLKGTIVLMGSTTPGLKDLRSTPIQNVYPGIEIHANLISGILDQNIKHRPGYTLGIEFLELLFIGIIMSLLLPRLSPLGSLLSTSFILGIAVWVNFYMWNHNLVVALASVLLLILILFVFHMSYGFFLEARGRRQIAKMFEHYVPPELVQEMRKNPSDFGMTGESREMTVLFTDIRDFTTISEKMAPKQIRMFMNELLTAMTRVIYKHRGTVDKYMGDSVMAFWGAPLLDKDHCHHALDAAFEMVEMVPTLRNSFEEKGWPSINIGIGLNTGIMNVGNMGSEFRMSYTVLGDAVNLGSRLESLTKTYGVSMIVSEFVKDKIPGYEFQELDRVRVKGKAAPVTIFQPLGHFETIDEKRLNERKRFLDALIDYRNQKWEEAEIQLQDLQKSSGTPDLCALYLERIKHFRKYPPGEDWDGVFTFQHK